MSTTSFKSRLVGILLIINVGVLALSGASYLFLTDLGQRLHDLTNGVYHRLEIANRLREAADGRALAVRNLALQEDRQASAKAAQSFELRQTEIRQALQELRDAVSNPAIPDEVRQKVDAIAVVESQYAPVAEHIVQVLKEGRREEAVTLIQTVCSPTLDQLMTAIHGYMALTTQRTRDYMSDTVDITAKERMALLAAALATAGLVGLLGLLLWRHVIRTLGTTPEALNQVLGHMAEGDLAGLHQGGQAPAGSVLEAMSRMQARMRGVVQEVRSVSTGIASGASEISTGNADLSQRTEQQASSLQQTASAMEQMNSAVAHSADSARTASSLASVVSDAAASGGEVMGQVIQTMHEISSSANRIEEIIGVIDGIAFQTNILALNAAVEAARAGEQGRGFAVVAGEVRSLARRSAEAAREIKDLIGVSSARVATGQTLVTEAGRRVSNIVSEVQRVTDLIHEMGHAAQEQSAGIAQVSRSVTELDQSTQQNAALAEQSAAAAESLRAQSDQLTRAVQFFSV